MKNWGTLFLTPGWLQTLWLEWTPGPLSCFFMMWLVSPIPPGVRRCVSAS